jgi:hypothetical protein
MKDKKMLNQDEYDADAKIKTQEGLLELGKELEKQKNMNNKLKEDQEKQKTILNKYKLNESEIMMMIENFSKDKAVLLIRIEGFVKELAFIANSHDSTILHYENKIKSLEKDIIDGKEEITSLIQESDSLENKIDELEDKIKSYWKVRVNNLRTKVMDKNVYINCLYGLIIISNMHSVLFSLYGFSFYIQFWRSFFTYGYIALFIVPHLLQMLVKIDTYFSLLTMIRNMFIYSMNFVLDFMYTTWMKLYLYVIGIFQYTQSLLLYQTLLIITLITGAIFILLMKKIA